MDGIWAEIITKEMAGLAAGAIALMVVLGRIPIKKIKLNETKFWKGWGAFAPGVNDIPTSQWGGVLIFGFVAALCAHLGRKFLKPIILDRLEGKSKE